MYTGEVITGGPADLRELPDVTIRKAGVSSMDNNCYLLTCRATGAQLLIDAADDAARLNRLVAEGGGGLDLVVTTHEHWDHHRALAAVLADTDARSAAGREDAGGLPVPPDRLLEQGDVLELGELRLGVVHLRGHTPGSIALVLHAGDGSVHAFTGDSLFPGGPGRASRPEDFTSLMDDLEERIFGALPDETWVYPGHGWDTTLSTERPHLREWRERGW